MCLARRRASALMTSDNSVVAERGADGSDEDPQARGSRSSVPPGS